MIDGKTAAENCVVRIYDASGRQTDLLTIKDNNVPTALNLSGYNNGIYFYKITSGNKVIQNKLVIIK